MANTALTSPLKPITGKQNRLWKEIKKHGMLYLFILPTMIYLAVFAYAPMYGVQIAFKNFNGALGIWNSPWVGLRHFQDFFKSYYFWIILRNTLTISIYSMALGFPTPIFLALLLNEIRNYRYKKFVQTVLYAPHFISMVVMVGMIILMLSPRSGMFNNLIELVGGERQYFMIDPGAFKHIYVLSGIWQNMGWSAIIYLAALSAVDPELHEVATIDGASRFQRIIHINLPTIRPTIVILFILGIGGLVGVGFEKTFLLQNDLNLEQSEVISTYVYRRGLMNANYSFASAVGLFNNIVNIILLLTANFIARKVGETSLF